MKYRTKGSLAFSGAVLITGVSLIIFGHISSRGLLISHAEKKLEYETSEMMERI